MMTNFLKDINCVVKNKEFTGNFDKNILSGNYGGQIRTARFKNVIEAFNFLLDYCILHDYQDGKHNRFFSFRTFIPMWALQPIDKEEDADENDVNLFDVSIIFNNNTINIVYYNDYSKKRPFNCPYKLKTPTDIKKYMEAVFKRKPFKGILTKQEDYFK
jgi:hypothetical protein